MRNRKAVIYIVILIVCFISILIRISMVKSDRGREIISYYGEWQKSGKPVEVRVIEAADVPVYDQFTVRAVDERIARGFVTGEVREALRPGQEIYAEDKSVSLAILKSVGKDLDLDTGMFPVAIEFKDSRDPGGVFVVSAHVVTLNNALVLPNEILDISAGEYFIWKDEAGFAKRHKVSIGSRDGYGAVVAEGLRPGDRVIVSGQSMLEDNDRLLVVNAAITDKAGKAR
ncbi:MAG: hypothetical protein PHH68_05135 [Candidatus Omnitrophica bacterium]|jgi:multidrug efflux pump subunit AcrA (membrane-fusion protein)|nr:hypothetical protein [Candidatus Omnitrophota bacterium]MDD5079696.1 hypothetical protein [Candidatus Omnitrophota bacterium]